MNDAVANDSLSALLIGEYSRDRLLVHEVFRAWSWRLFEAGDRRHAMDCLERHGIAVVIAESDVPNWNWKKILHDLRTLSAPPQLIVTSRHADDYLWAEVLNCGAYDVLQQPFDREELERVIAAAGRHFDRKPVRTGARKAAALTAGAA
jgi:DNA-binding response OmpR family regulator